MEYVIFAIDNGHKVHERAKFLRHMDTVQSMGKMQGTMQTCIGYWEGILENSYILTVDDYQDFVVKYCFTDKQECVLVVPQDTRQPCHVATPKDLGFLSGVGVMHEVQSIDGLSAWTYNETSGKYFATKED